MADAAGGANGLHFKAPLEFIQPLPEAFATPEEYGHEHDVHLVDQAGSEKLAEGRRPSADANVQAAGRLSGNLQGFERAGVDEVERRPAFHLDRGPGVVGEHEHRGVKDRIIPPPARPLLVGPLATVRSKTCYVP